MYSLNGSGANIYPTNISSAWGINTTSKLVVNQKLDAVVS